MEESTTARRCCALRSLLRQLRAGLRPLMFVVSAACKNIRVGFVGVHAYRNRLCVSSQCSSEFIFLVTDSCTAVGALLRAEVSVALGGRGFGCVC
jgi:hypothetical protein